MLLISINMQTFFIPYTCFVTINITHFHTMKKKENIMWISPLSETLRLKKVYVFVFFFLLRQLLVYILKKLATSRDIQYLNPDVYSPYRNVKNNWKLFSTLLMRLNYINCRSFIMYVAWCEKPRNISFLKSIHQTRHIQLYLSIL